MMMMGDDDGNDGGFDDDDNDCGDDDDDNDYNGNKVVETLLPD